MLRRSSLALLLLFAAGCAGSPSAPAPPVTLRVATFNTALERGTAGALVAELEQGSAQARAVAEIVQRVRPDVLVLQELDRDPAGRALALLRARYLGVGQGDQAAIDYPYVWHAPSNTGVPSGLDLDRDGKTDGPGDALGFGRHPGHYAFAVLSKFPLGPRRTFRTLRWQAMPGALLPVTEAGPWYSPEALEALPLSSKNHVDQVVQLPEGTALHLLIAHPTPPVFDGPEDRNGRRNHDEIRLWADYLSGADYLVDDDGVAGGLAADAAFVILGDYNADPVDGDSVDGAIAQLLDHPRITRVTPTSTGGAARPARDQIQGDPARHTAGWGLRVDYTLPSKGSLEVLGSGIFWPAEGEPGAALVGVAGAPPKPVSSDHRLVWVDLRTSR